MITHQCQSHKQDFFNRESMDKHSIYVKTNDTVVCDSSAVLHVVLGSCISCVLTGADPSGRIWLAANHLFKSREQNDDVSLYHIAALHDTLSSKGVRNISCLGLFGGGYSANSPAGKTAKNNVITSLESISFFNMSVELFETGYKQSLSICVSGRKNAVLLRHKTISSGSTVIYEFPADAYFQITE